MSLQENGRKKYRKLGKKRTVEMFKTFCNYHEYDFNKYKGKQDKSKIARNLVDYEYRANNIRNCS